jgi:photosystem II stability/assembly factor-like uncharacterized protein
VSIVHSFRFAVVALLGTTCLGGEASAQHFPATAYQDLHWRSVGPPRGGRTRAVAGVPDEPNVFYVGAVNGGVWKTNDAGRTWQPIFDDQPTQSIGAIAVAPSDANIVYVGSGEGLFRPDLSVGDGIYRSADAGRTWEHLGLRGGQQIPELAIDPRDPNRLYAAVLGHPYGPSAERGIYRSTDGGRNWQRVLYNDENTGGSSIAIDPQHPDVLFAGLWEGRLGPSEDNNEFNGTGGGLYKSTDGGTNWHKVTAGLPDKLAQLNIAVAASAPERIYLVAGTTDPGDYSSAAGLGLYRSDDSGEHWARVTQDPRPALRIGGGDLAVLRVDPTNPDVVYSASLVAVKSVDGGKSWESLRGAPGGDDYQNLWINPHDPKVIALVADQGALVTVNGGQTWSSWFNQPTAQLYHIGITPTFPYRLCSGQQESGSVCITSRGNDGQITARDWHPVGAIEYGYVAPDPLDADIIYGAGRTEVSKFHVSTGQVQDVTPLPLRAAGVRADRTEPLMFAPLDPHTLYFATNRLYRTSDGGEHWQVISPDLARAAPGVPPSVGTLHPPEAQQQRGVIYALAASPVSGDTLWAGTDDGLVWLTRDGGRQWSEVTPAALTPWSKVTQVEASHFDPATAYISVSRLRIDDLHPFIYRTRDAGKTWQPVVVGLPEDAPVNAVREDPVRRGLLYAATEHAVWVSFDDGEHWDSLQANLPHTSMRDLAIHDADLVVATHGRGFWILDDISRLRQLAPGKLDAPFLVAPAAALRVARSTWSDTPIPPDEPTAANPPAGAVLEYFLPLAAKGVVVLEVLDAQGALVRRYASDDPPDAAGEEPAHQLIPTYWAEPARSLGAGAGMHRWVWDFRYPAPLTLRRGFPISAVPHATPREPLGPLAAPGAYTVRLSVDGRRLETALLLKADPRVHLGPDDFAAQSRLALQLAALLSESSRSLLEVRSTAAQLQALRASGRARAEARALAARLAPLLKPEKAAQPEKSAEAVAPRRLPEVQADISSLYTAVMRSDAPPTEAQLRESVEAGKALTGLVGSWRAIEMRLPALNAHLRSAGLAPVSPQVAPPVDLDSIDVDEE